MLSIYVNKQKYGDVNDGELLKTLLEAMSPEFKYLSNEKLIEWYLSCYDIVIEGCSTKRVYNILRKKRFYLKDVLEDVKHNRDRLDKVIWNDIVSVVPERGLTQVRTISLPKLPNFNTDLRKEWFKQEIPITLTRKFIVVEICVKARKPLIGGNNETPKTDFKFTICSPSRRRK